MPFAWRRSFIRDGTPGKGDPGVPGDANLDGTFDSQDLVSVFQSNHYEDEIRLNSRWADGDWNGDGEFDSSDLVRAFQIGGFF
jgi:hypothetical protein